MNRETDFINKLIFQMFDVTTMKILVEHFRKQKVESKIFWRNKSPLF